jgi:hypothetical protein
VASDCLRPRQGDPLKSGLDQLDEYLSRLSPGTGTLVIFDPRPGTVRKGPRTEITETRSPGGRAVTLLRA